VASQIGGILVDAKCPTALEFLAAIAARQQAYSKRVTACDAEPAGRFLEQVGIGLAECT
jgi:hypothetical protein